MFPKNSVYYHFHRSSVGWLRYQEGRHQQILNADLIRIIEDDKELIPDDTLRRLVLAGLKGELKAKRGPKIAPNKKVREARAVNLYEQLLPEMQELAKERRAKGIRRSKGDLSPSDATCQLVAEQLGFATWEAVRNLVSRTRIAEKAHEENMGNHVSVILPDV